MALFYLSAWKNTASAQTFAQLYANDLGRKYSGLKLDLDAQRTAAPGVDEQDFSTSEGPVVITTRGKLVFVAESFPLNLARKLTTLVLDAQGAGDMKMAGARVKSRQPYSTPAPGSEAMQPLTANLIHFFSNCGVMKAAVDGALQAAN